MTRLFSRAISVIAWTWIGALAGCGGGGGNSPAGRVTACQAISVSSSTDAGLGSVADGAVVDQIKSLGLPGAAVGIAKRGTVLYAKGYGYANISSCTPMQAETEFQIGSVTKQFTAASILQLQSSGLLGLDDPMLAYLPAYAFDARITVRMLLNQTSGLDDYINFPAASSWEAGVSEQTVLTQIANASLLFQPGIAYSYSNSNYYVLGSIIEKVSSLLYSTYLSDHIFQAAGISHTSYTEPSTFASAYSQGPTSATIADPSFEFAAGALWSNVNDLSLWNGALFNGQIVSPTSFALMTTPPSVNDFQQGVPSSYAMGWARGMAAGHPFIWHDGETFGYSALNGIFLDDGFSITILTTLAVSGETMESFAVAVMHAICSTPATAGNC